MALVKKPPVTVNHTLILDQPVSELLDDYLANFTRGENPRA
jgi:hypothetical protein